MLWIGIEAVFKHTDQRVLAVQRLHRRPVTADQQGAGVPGPAPRDLTTPKERDNVTIRVRENDFEMHRGRVLIGFSLSATDSSALDPRRIGVVPAELHLQDVVSRLQ